MDNASRLLLTMLAAEFVDDDLHRSEHYIHRDELAEIKYTKKQPSPGMAVKVTFEFVEEGVLCEPLQTEGAA